MQEQLSRSVITPAADIYSLGVLTYELLTQEQPFMGETTLEIMNQIARKKPLKPSFFRSEIPAAMDGLIIRMLNKDPRKRPPLQHIRTEIEKISTLV